MPRVDDTQRFDAELARHLAARAEPPRAARADVRKPDEEGDADAGTSDLAPSTPLPPLPLDMSAALPTAAPAPPSVAASSAGMAPASVQGAGQRSRAAGNISDVAADIRGAGVGSNALNGGNGTGGIGIAGGAEGGGAAVAAAATAQAPAAFTGHAHAADLSGAAARPSGASTPSGAANVPGHIAALDAAAATSNKESAPLNAATVAPAAAFGPARSPHIFTPPQAAIAARAGWSATQASLASTMRGLAIGATPGAAAAFTVRPNMTGSVSGMAVNVAMTPSGSQFVFRCSGPSQAEFVDKHRPVLESTLRTGLNRAVSVRIVGGIDAADSALDEDGWR